MTCVDVAPASPQPSHPRVFSSVPPRTATLACSVQVTRCWAAAAPAPATTIIAARPVLFRARQIAALISDLLFLYERLWCPPAEPLMSGAGKVPPACWNTAVANEQPVRYTGARMSSDRSPSVKGYEVFFGFREPPFSLAPDTRFLFDGASHAAAREQVAYALERREPLVVVTGEIGTGKTLLCRSVVKQLERRTFLSIIHDPLLDRDDLLKQMLQDFGVISKDRTRLAATSRHDLVHALQEFLLSLAPLQAHAVLVIDEAQHLQPDVMEQLRLISNVHDDAGALLQIILVGQPSLDAVLLRPELRQLKQRVSRHVRLEPLGIAELSQYIDHRLAIARDGGRPKGVTTFTPEALSAIWRLSGGTPRVINLLCDRSLEAAYEQQARSVDAPLIDGAAAELGIQRPPVAPAPTARSVPAAAADYPPEKPAHAEALQVAA